MSNESIYERWLESLPGSPAPSKAADMSGKTRSTVLRQMRSEDGLTMEMIRDISVSAGANPIAELIRLGKLSVKDLNALSVKAALKQAGVTDLIDELWERAKDPKIRAALNPKGDNITDIDSRRSLAEQSIAHDVYAADSSPTEPLPGDDDYHDGP